MREYVETYTTGNYRTYYQNYLEAWAYKDGTQIGSYPRYTPGGQNLTANRTFTVTLQTFGPGRYTSTGRHQGYNQVCSYWEGTFDTGTSVAGYIDIVRPDPPDYASFAGNTRYVYFLGKDLQGTVIPYSGNYRAQTVLVAGNPRGAIETPTWIFKAGSTYGSLNCTQCSQPLFTASRKGSGCNVYDVVLVTSYNGFESQPFWMFINAPTAMIGVADLEGGTWDYTYPFFDGFETRINYKTLSMCQLDAPMYYYDINETLGTWANDYTNANWIAGPATGGVILGDQWFDRVNFWTGATNACSSFPCNPLPLNPGADYTRVHHSFQTWFVGSPTPGQGVRIMTNTLYRYRDQATHESITNPAP